MNERAELSQWKDALEASLPRIGHEPIAVRVFQETASTQDVAKTFAPRRALVVTDQQTAGRGRLGRSWVSAPGSCVLMSLCWPIDVGATHDRVSMLSGIAVARAVETLMPGITARLKWPNDVMINGRKLAGILIEAINGAFVIGIGLNVTPQSVADPDLKDIATCLAEHGSPPDRLRVIEQIIIEVDQSFHTSNHPLMLDEWRGHAALGQMQTFTHNGQRITGEVLDLDPDHGLIVRRDTGEITTLPAATTSVVS